MAYNQNPYSNWNTGSDGGSPSIAGALPYINSSYPLPPKDLVTFTFTSLNPTILNCTVLGPNNRANFSVSTNASMAGYTVFKDAESRNIALIEWQNRPYRAVDIRGARYTWAPQDQYICLWAAACESSGRRCLARISKTYNIVSMEMTPEALQLGLLEACVITTVLLQCGRNID
ncbi:hypothetical protein FIBSPDRAFT_909295 [Athelia psychrophila]|uniref:Uncharacterized protein n=1 Tax=Athelia psychrophila TaxID=1759441 RepID=A0A166PRA6_9AGAM|nr:hypothetical protein FIBSPDRAFT_909295 [Fibularhizoctonia sp. CBS 109695]